MLKNPITCAGRVTKLMYESNICPAFISLRLTAATDVTELLVYRVLVGYIGIVFASLQVRSNN